MILYLLDMMSDIQFYFIFFKNKGKNVLKLFPAWNLTVAFS